MHTFSDGGLIAFAAQVFLRVRKNDLYDVRFLGAKTRVVPTNGLSIPRTELQGFILGIRWTESLVKGLWKINIARRIYWVDSKNCINWMESNHRKYSPFVAHRISEALDYFESNKNASYRYVPTKQNTADFATKWHDVDLSPQSPWVTGPEFLYKPMTEWPENLKPVATIEELRPCFMHQREKKQLNWLQFDKYSSIEQALRHMGRIYRVIRNMQRKRHGYG